MNTNPPNGQSPNSAKPSRKYSPRKNPLDKAVFEAQESLNATIAKRIRLLDSVALHEALLAKAVADSTGLDSLIATLRSNLKALVDAQSTLRKQG